MIQREIEHLRIFKLKTHRRASQMLSLHMMTPTTLLDTNSTKILMANQTILRAINTIKTNKEPNTYVIIMRTVNGILWPNIFMILMETE